MTILINPVEVATELANARTVTTNFDEWRELYDYYFKILTNMQIENGESNK